MPLPQIDYVDYNDVLKSEAQGYAMGKDRLQRNTMATAGQSLAKGDYKGAKNAFFQGGDVDGGLKIQQHIQQMDDRQREATKRISGIVGNLALAADTPEKWSAAIQGLQSRGINVSKYADFGTRDAALAEAGMTAQYLERADALRKEQQPTYQFTEAGAFNPKDGTLKGYPEGITAKRTELERRAIAGGLVPGTPEYQDYVLSGPEKAGKDARTELEKRAIAGGLKPGTEEYQDYILSGPEKAGKAGKDTTVKDAAKLEQDIRKEHAALSKDARIIRDAISRVEVGAKIGKGAGDIALIYGFMNLNDPGSVVRETEFDIAKNIGSLPEKWRSSVLSMLEGSQLPDGVRAEILATAKELGAAKMEEQNTIDQRFTDIATNAGLDPARVVLPYGQRTPKQPPNKPLPPGGFPATMRKPDPVAKAVGEAARPSNAQAPDIQKLNPEDLKTLSIEELMALSRGR